MPEAAAPCTQAGAPCTQAATPCTQAATPCTQAATFCTQARDAFRIEELLLTSDARAQLFIFGQCCPFVVSKLRHFLVTWTGSAWPVPPPLPLSPIPPPPSPPAHRTAPRARRVAVPARLQVQLISYLLWLYLPRLQVQLIFYSVFSSHIEVAFTITCDTAVGVRANAPSTSLLRVPATLTPRHPCSAGRAAV